MNVRCSEQAVRAPGRRELTAPVYIDMRLRRIPVDNGWANGRSLQICGFHCSLDHSPILQCIYQITFIPLMNTILSSHTGDYGRDYDNGPFWAT